MRGLQVADVKRQAGKALKHLRQQLLAAQQQHEAQLKKVLTFALVLLTSSLLQADSGRDPPMLGSL